MQYSLKSSSGASEGDEDKYILVRPLGGMNDVLCQIQICWDYAMKTQRKLLVDTEGSGLMGPFDAFFTIQCPGRESPTLRLSPELIEYLNNLETFPPAVAGKVESYQTKYVSGEGVVELETKTPLKLDLSKDYDEQLLIHQASGGGRQSEALLPYLRIRPEISQAISTALALLGTDYYSLHIRRQEFASVDDSSYKGLIKIVLRKAKKRGILLVSDGPEVHAFAKNIVPSESLLLSRTKLPPKNGSHYREHYSDQSERLQATIDSIVDVCLAASATRFFYSIQFFGSVSGYSGLIAFLSRNQHVLSELTGIPLATEPRTLRPIFLITARQLGPTCLLLTRKIRGILGFVFGALRKVPQSKILFFSDSKR